jgi:hypothetical protein
MKDIFCSSCRILWRVDINMLFACLVWQNKIFDFCHRANSGGWKRRWQRDRYNFARFMKGNICWLGYYVWARLIVARIYERAASIVVLLVSSIPEPLPWYYNCHHIWIHCKNSQRMSNAIFHTLGYPSLRRKWPDFLVDSPFSQC